MGGFESGAGGLGGVGEGGGGEGEWGGEGDCGEVCWVSFCWGGVKVLRIFFGLMDVRLGELVWVLAYVHQQLSWKLNVDYAILWSRLIIFHTRKAILLHTGLERCQ